MTLSFTDAVKNRRSCYTIKKSSPITDKQIEEILEFVILNTPSAFNSQSARFVLLLGKESDKLWDIVKNTLKAMVPPANFPKTEEKINSFKAGYGTILFFEDTTVVEGLQAKFPSYKDNFPVWSEQSAGMHQFAVWCMLEGAGLGASLQHYNPIIDEEVKKTWNIDSKWKLRAQMPFGTPEGDPGPKTFEPVEARLKVFK
ncbi:hypothetical protein Dip510_001797 [Elusimicrobium posterum]|uniref:nitroreductase family protein n=1 Tax=Elusimicrobium posterum TaxID=3116653 RepID=UPI003C73036B